MAIDYSNLANTPDTYVDISFLAKEDDRHERFNLSDLRGVQGVTEENPEGTVYTEGDSGDQGPSGAGPLPPVEHPGLETEEVVFPEVVEHQTDAPADEALPAERPTDTEPSAK